ncbi:hypothetical protein J2S01_000717 [Pectinatus haikarae]|uniref:Uncharacterized protein n=1 Tax=Pectinatus haikarae TaxID=349096 RepID=A0ABT9Y5M5_9FIRM|nr:hypothetical protein [Pectinatus haikarae]
MHRFRGYLRTLKQYLHTAKGRHDFLDYLRALFIMLMIMLVMYLLIKYLSGEYQ